MWLKNELVRWKIQLENLYIFHYEFSASWNKYTAECEGEKI